MWLWDALFCVWKKYYLLKYYCWKVKMVRHGWPCGIVHHVILMWMTKLTIIWLLFLLALMYVVCAIFKGRNYVGVWLVFEWLAYGMLDTNHKCRNPIFGLATKVGACKGAGQEGSSGVISHAPGSVGECEGMNTHTPKWAPILGVRVLTDSWIFREWL